MKAINDRWSQGDGPGEEEEDEEGSEDSYTDDEAPSPAAPTAKDLGIDARLLDGNATLAQPRVPSYGSGLSLAFKNDHESSEGDSDETEDEMPTK